MSRTRHWGQRIAAACATVAIVVAWPTGASFADKPSPVVSITDVTVTEGDSGNTIAEFTISIDDLRGKGVTVAWRTRNGTASAATDYFGMSGVFDLSRKNPSETVSVLVRGDTLEEADETLDVVIAVDGGEAPDDTGTATILNDDITIPTE